MDHGSELVVCMGSGAQREAAEALARRTGAPLTDAAGDGLTLLIDKSGVSLTGGGLSLRGDFEQMLHRISDGRLSHEMLVKIAKTKTPHPVAVDATAGLGEDSLLLAAAGYEVVMFERDAVIAALLRDALRRAKKNPALREIAARMRLIEGNSVELMSSAVSQPELIYLDPMFPSRRKSGLIGKKLQLIQKLEQPCADEEELLNAALNAKPAKIIIKRPLKGGFLAGRKPNYSVKGKAIRYDCVLPQR